VTRAPRGIADLPPGPARDLRDLLRRLRQRHGSSLGQVAARAGLSRSHISEVLRGWKTPSPQAATQLARALDATDAETRRARHWAERARELQSYHRTPGADRRRPDRGHRHGDDLSRVAPEPGSHRPAPAPRQLPADVAAFTGRTAELAQLDRLLASAAAATDVSRKNGVAAVISAVSGTAGVGKTALAVHWAHSAAARFPDGQLYVNLRGYDPDEPMTPADALAGFLRALGVSGQDIPPAEDERAAWYRSLLAGRRMLVVLDNAGSEEQVRPLLPGSASAAALVTSRDALAGLVARDGATRLDVDLLSQAEAVSLLRNLIGPRAADDPAATGTLVARCGRLPLALRVAAEFVAVRPDVPLADLVGELAGQQQPLDMFDTGGDPRTAVRAVFSWSYRHLEPGAARAFRLVGLHPGPSFDPYAVAALADLPLEQSRRALGRLARAHLIQPAAPGRHGLHDLLRLYARELADNTGGQDEQRAALTRLFDYFLHTAATAIDTLYPAERHRRPRIPPPASPAPPVADSAEARAWLDSERTTLVAVAVYAAKHGWPEHATRLAATLFRYLEFGSHYPEAITVHTHACLAARQAGDRAAEATALNALGVIDWHQGRIEQATDNFASALTLFQQTGDRTSEARVLSNLGVMRSDQGRYQQATGLHEQALQAFREIRDTVGEGLTLGNLGIVEERQGRYRPAALHLQQSLAIARSTGDRHSECTARVILGVVALAQDHYEQASDQLGQALALCRETGYRAHEAGALTRIGDLRLRQGHLPEAARHLQEALSLYREIGDRAGEADALNSLGAALRTAGQPVEARTQHGAALRLATQIGDRHQQARAQEGLGHTYAASDAALAGEYWQKALAIYTDLGVPEADQVRARLSGNRRPERAEAGR